MNIMRSKADWKARRKARGKADLFDAGFDPNQERDDHGRWAKGATLYHGSPKTNLESILQKGLIIGKRRFGAQYYDGERGQVIYLAKDIKAASNFASGFVDGAIFEVHVPKEEAAKLKPDELDPFGNYWMFPKQIPVEWIKAYYTTDGYDMERHHVRDAVPDSVFYIAVGTPAKSRKITDAGFEDPTAHVRKAFWKEGKKRWKQVEAAVREGVKTYDFMGVGDRITPFHNWLDQLMTRYVIGNGRWMDRYLDQAAAIASQRASTLVTDAGFDPNQPRDEKGQWSLVGFKGRVKPHTVEAMRKMADDVADVMRYPRNKIHFSNKRHTMQLNGETFSSAGIAINEDIYFIEDEVYQKGDIVLFVPDVQNESDVAGVIAHEIEHQKFANVLDYGMDELRVASRKHEEKLFNPDQSINTKYKNEFPVAYALDEFGVLGKDGDKLADNDGVSPYSREYWNIFVNEPSIDTFHTAIHETLAEMARFRYGKKQDPFVVSKNWADLFDFVDKEYRRLNHIKDAGFDPNQLRAPKGTPIGGRWIPKGNPLDYSDFTPPKKTLKAYKLFRTLKSRPGELFPTQVDITTSIPIGKWVPASYKPTKGFKERPGWHGGTVPMAPQMRNKQGYKQEHLVWGEVEFEADDHEAIQAEADSRPDRMLGKEIPKGGYYKFHPGHKNYRDSWVISGAMKVNRLMSDDEVYKVLMKHGYPEDAKREAPKRYTQDAYVEVADDYSIDAGFDPNQERDWHGRWARGHAEQTQTDAFRKWFGNSKLTNEDGSPMILYHQTSKAFKTFKLQGEISPKSSGNAFWFTDNPDNIPSAHRTGYGENYKEGTNVLPVYVRMERPLYMNTDDPDEMKGWYDLIAGGKGNFGLPQLVSDKVRNRLIELGYDGIVALRSGRENEYVALYEDQIKSAIGNKGTFDPKSKKITDAAVDWQRLSHDMAVTELRGVLEATLQQATRALGKGIMERRDPTRDVLKVLRMVGEARTKMLAEYAVIKIFSVATLESFRAQGIGTVGIIPEKVPHMHVTDAARKTKQPRGKGGKFRKYVKPLSAKNQRKAEKQYLELRELNKVNVLTAEDDRVCDTCERIADNGPYSIDRALSLIPAHINCRCIFIPLGKLPMYDAGFDPNQKRDEHGRWTREGLSQLGAKAEWIRDKIDVVADQLKFPKDRIFMSNADHRFTLAGQNFRAGGVAVYSPLGYQTSNGEKYGIGDIVIFGKEGTGFNEDFPVRGITAHEIMHQKYREVMGRLKEEDKKYWDNHLYREDPETLRKEIPVYAALKDAGWMDDDIRIRLEEEDGVTQYSAMYWSVATSEKPEAIDLAINETLSEIAALKSNEEDRYLTPETGPQMTEFLRNWLKTSYETRGDKFASPEEHASQMEDPWAYAEMMYGDEADKKFKEKFGTSIGSINGFERDGTPKYDRPISLWGTPDPIISPTWKKLYDTIEEQYRRLNNIKDGGSEPKWLTTGKQSQSPENSR